MKNDRHLLFEDLHRILSDLPRTDDDWQVTAERALGTIKSLLARLLDLYDRLDQRDDD